MKPGHTCPACGTALDAEAPQGLCPRCLLAGAMDTLTGPTGTQIIPPAGAHPAGAGLVDAASGGPARFGDYELLEPIATGGMGVVWKARQISLNRPVALKRILSGRFASEAEVKRFRTEAEAAAKLQHPNIVAVHEVGERDGHHFFSMELIEGRDLAEMVFAGPIDPERAARYVRDVALAIQHAHERGVLHRDLKPSNILIDAQDRPRVTDFGIARLEGASGLTQTGAAMGTPAYMSPEQASGRNAEVGPASDVYSLGAILYELLTGRAPFRAATPVETMRQVLEAEPASPSWVNPNVPVDLSTLCLKCLEKDPGRRYGSAQELAADLGRFLNHEPVLARPATRLLRLRKWARRKPAHAALVGVSALALVLLAAGVMRYAATLRQHGVALNDRLHHTLLEQARAERLLGHRETALQRVRDAAALGRSPELRTEAIQALAEPGLRQIFEAEFGQIIVSRLSPDGRFLALGGGAYVRPDWPGFQTNAWQTLVRVWDVASSNLLVEMPWHLSGGPFAFSPDSRILAVPGWGNDGAEVGLWEVLRGTVQARVPAGGMPSFSPEGRWLAIQESRRVSACRGTNFESRVVFDQPAAILAWTGPDELLLQRLDSDENGRLVRWDLARDRRTYPLNDGGFVRGRDGSVRPVGAGPKPGAVEAVAVSEDGCVAAIRRLVASGSAGEELAVLDLATGTQLASLSMPLPFPSPFLLGPGARKLVFPDTMERGRLRVFDVVGERFVQGVGEAGTRLDDPFMHFEHGRQHTGQGSSSGNGFEMRYTSYPVLRTTRALPRPSAPWRSPVRGLHPQGHLLAAESGVGERKLVVWELDSGRPIAALPKLSLPVWSGEGRWLFAKGNGMIALSDKSGRVLMRSSGEVGQLFELLPGTESHRLGTPVRVLQFSPDGRQLAVNLESQGSQIWDVLSLGTGPSLRATTNRLSGEEVFFRQDRNLALNDRNHFTVDALARVRLLGERDALPLQGGGWVRGRDVAPDGRHLLLACSAVRGDTRAPVPGPHLQWWDLQTRRRLAAWPHPGRTGSYGTSDRPGPVVISPDGRWAAVSCFSGSGFEIWDLSTGRRAHDVFRDRTPPPPPSQRQQFLRQLRAWVFRGPAAGAPAAEPFFDEQNVNAIVFTPDSRRVISSADDRAVIRDVASGSELFQCRAGTNILSLAVSPDGRTLVTGDEAGVLRLWEMASGRLLAHWPVHEAAATALAFSPDGTVLVTGARDGGLKLWRLAQLRHELARLGLDW